MNLFERRITDIAKSNDVVDIGGGKGFQKVLAPYRELFHDTYRTLDSDRATHPDIIGDALSLPFPDSSRSAFLSISMLEHVSEPQRAINEMHRTLVPGGQVLLYVPFLYPYHARPGAYRDYFR
ncbi:MAG TPA: class I SAM-dependent methyltransferase, partial [Candidatus Paceibacterota bacterium]|nr:class I SAM-dependent methyltransferase [Candidatus Paceibacterota bacterium]